jgi:hypothetical protein
VVVGVTVEVAGVTAEVVEVTADVAEVAAVVADAAVEVAGVADVVAAEVVGVVVPEPVVAAEVAGVTAEVADVAVEVAGVAAVVADAAAEVAGVAAGVAVEVAAGVADVVAAEVAGVAVEVAEVAAEVADATAEVAAEVTEVAVPEPMAGTVAARACRENASKMTRMPAAVIATCTARRAMCRKIGCGMSSSPTQDRPDPATSSQQQRPQTRRHPVFQAYAAVVIRSRTWKVRPQMYILSGHHRTTPTQARQDPPQMTAELTPGPRNPEILDNYDYPGPSGRLQAPHLCPAADVPEKLAAFMADS